MDTFLYPDLFYTARSTSTAINKTDNQNKPKRSNLKNKIKPAQLLKRDDSSTQNTNLNQKDLEELYWFTIKEKSSYSQHSDSNRVKAKTELILPKLEEINTNHSTTNTSKKYDPASKPLKSQNLSESNAITAASLVDLNRQSMDSFVPLTNDFNKHRYLHGYLSAKKTNINSYSPTNLKQTHETNRQSTQSPSLSSSGASTFSYDTNEKQKIYFTNSLPLEVVEGSKMNIEEVNCRKQSHKETHLKELSQKSGLYKLREEPGLLKSEPTQFRLKPLESSQTPRTSCKNRRGKRGEILKSKESNESRNGSDKTTINLENILNPKNCNILRLD